MKTKKPKISIITPTFNHSIYIRDNIESVLSQDYENYEHIITDGGSTDDTVIILDSYDHIKWISEKDKGPVDAIMKGFNMASGDILTWLNSDDFYPPNILSIVADTFVNENVEMVIGNMKIVMDDKTPLFETRVKEKYSLDYLVKVNSDIITQPSTFFTKKLFYDVGGFDNSLRLIWDYDLFLKMLGHTEPYFLDEVLAYQRIYDSTLSRGFAREQALEIFKTSRKYGAKITDPINRMILKRFLFPSVIKKNPGGIIKLYRSIISILKK